MKRLFTILVAAALCFSACKKDEQNSVVNISDGVDPGEEVTYDDDEVNSTLNLEGGDVTVEGSTTVTADINITDTASTLIVTDSAELHQINLTGGCVYISGSTIINNDFNVNSGTVYVGSDYSLATDTVKIMGNFNLNDSLWVNGGVLLVGTDFNQSAFVNIATDAKIIVKHDMNHGADLYGAQGLTVEGTLNENSGVMENAPVE